MILAHKEELAEIESLDNGKPFSVAKVADIPLAADLFHYMAGWATKIEGNTIPVSVPYTPDQKYLAYTQATLMILGWAFTQYPYIVREQVTLYNAGAPKSTLHFVIIALIIAAIFIIPSFYFMYKVFRKI